MEKSKRWEKGAAKLKQLFGNEPQPDDMYPDFQKITVENLFGDVWNRPRLELRERSMITASALTVLGRWPELKIHLRGDFNVGITREMISEMMIHLAHYGGWPVGISGWHTAKKVFGEIDNQNKE